MNDDLESKLRAALRPESPKAGFTDKVMARVARADLPALPPLPSRRGERPRVVPRVVWWCSAGIAATLVLTFGVHQRVLENRERESGLEARRQVLDALQLTDRKLDLAYRTLKDQSPGA
jgi:hypothetical protein